MPRFLVAAGLAAVLLAASGGCASGEKTAGPSLASRPRSTATVSIAEPVPGAVIRGPKLSVRISLVGGRIIPETKTQLRPDEGHIHVLIDGQVKSMT